MRRMRPSPCSYAAVALVVVGLARAVADSTSSSSNPTRCGLSVLLPKCPSGSFCLYTPNGDCGGTMLLPTEGVCTSTPEVCAAVVQPVCGCDGATYPNECSAHLAGVSVKAEGACTQSPLLLGGLGTSNDGSNESHTCTSSSLLSCPSDRFCQFVDPQTNEETCAPARPSSKASSSDQAPAALGTCVQRPDMCAEAYQPVCGCNGETYPNVCAAHREGVSVAGQGSCETADSCGGLVGKACANETHYYCHFGGGSCGAGDRTGVCRLRQQACNKMLAPVCGCDGKTYSNACMASNAGMSLVSLGPCPTPTRCGDGAGMCEQLSDKHHCKFNTGVCGRYKQLGLCTRTPAVCDSTLKPVCGCDGRSYENECAAGRAGVSVAAAGECPFGPMLHNANSTELEKAAIELAADLSLMAANGTTKAKCIISESQFGVPCPLGFFCDFESNSCGNDGKTTGVCISVPSTCSEDAYYAPEVCGCDGKSYESECVAAANLVPLRSGTASCEILRANATTVTTSPASPPQRSIGQMGVITLLLVAVVTTVQLSGGYLTLA